MKFSLSRKIALMLLFIAFSLSIALILLSYSFYRQRTMEHYEAQAKNIAAIAAMQVDPDRISYYLDKALENPDYKLDVEYQEIYEKLSELQRVSGVEYIYIVKPEEEEVYYILDTDPDLEGRKELGDHEPYYQGDFSEHREDMVKGRELDAMFSNEEYGWLMSAYCAMRTSSGNPAGYVGVDIDMNDVKDDLRAFSCYMALLMVIMTAGLTLFFIWLTTLPMRLFSLL